jgi:NAD+ kinase
MTFTRPGLVARVQLPPALEALTEAAAWLGAHGCHPVIERASAEAAGLTARYAAIERPDLPTHADVIVAFGGDGTLLEAAGSVARAGADTPVLGINLGRLGFLTEVSRADLVEALDALVAGRARSEERLLLTGEVRRGSTTVATRVALNDVVVTRGALARMVEIDVDIDGQPVCQVKADGLIIATATGSTAYNLSAGGPILHPAVDAFVLTPIAPHTLTNRPLVLPATARIDLRPIIEGATEIVVTFDGQAGVPLEAGDVIEVRRAARVVRLLRTSSRTHFDMLREKLQWGKA